MGILKAIGEAVERAATQHVSNESFRRGQEAEPPLRLMTVSRDTEEGRAIHEMMDDSYQKGQMSAAVKLANKLSD